MDAPATPLPHGKPASTAVRFGLPIVVFVLSVACFLPAMRNGFVKWDDNGNFLTNTEYQTLSWTSVKWALTTRLMGHYQPLNWLTFIADHALAGVIGPAGPRADDDPYLTKVLPKSWPTHPPSAGRFHQTQAILHGIAAVLVYFLALWFLTPRDECQTPAIAPWLAAFAALLFAVHPLRVESVAWASARTDVLAAIFMTSATLVYLRGFQGCPAMAAPRARDRILVAVLMALAVSSKVMAITLPVVLLVLDGYLGRMKAQPGGPGFISRIARLVGQKAELFGLSVAFTCIGKWAHSGSIVDLHIHSVSNRIAQFFVSLAFYPYRTLLPLDLSPLYEFPARFGWTHPQVLLSFGGVVVALILLVKFTRSPAIWTAIAAYLVMIAPVTGLTQRGSQMVADRYSYIACIPLALLAAGLLGRLAHRQTRLAIGLATTVLLLYVLQTQRQIGCWHDSKRLWEHAIALDPTNASAYAAMGSIYDASGMPEKALNFYHKSVSIRHSQFGVWYAIGNLHRDAGNDEEAKRCYLTELEIAPDHPNARTQLCLILAKQGRFAEAEPHLRRLCSDWWRTDDTMIRHMLADACAERGDFREALHWLDEALAIARRRNLPHVIALLTSARAEYAAAATSQPERSDALPPSTQRGAASDTTSREVP